MSDSFRKHPFVTVFEVVMNIVLGGGSLADCSVLVESWVRKGYGTLAFSNLAIAKMVRSTDHMYTNMSASIYLPEYKAIQM